MKRLIQQVFLAPSHALALKRGRALIARFRDRYSAAMACLERDLEECVTYLHFPTAHHHQIRTTERLERLNGEGRRRTKVIPRLKWDDGQAPERDYAKYIKEPDETAILSKIRSEKVQR